MIQGAAFWAGWWWGVYFLLWLDGREGGPLEGEAFEEALELGGSPRQSLWRTVVPLAGGRRGVGSIQQGPGPTLHHQVVLGMGKAGLVPDQRGV